MHVGQQEVFCAFTEGTQKFDTKSTIGWGCGEPLRTNTKALAIHKIKTISKMEVCVRSIQQNVNFNDINCINIINPFKEEHKIVAVIKLI